MGIVAAAIADHPSSTTRYNDYPLDRPAMDWSDLGIYYWGGIYLLPRLSTQRLTEVRNKGLAQKQEG